MSKFFLRFILFAVFFPLIFVILFVIPQFNFLALTVLILIVSLVGSFETENIFRQKYGPASRFLMPLAGGFLPLVAYLGCYFPALSWLPDAYLIVLIVIVFLRVVLYSREKDFPRVLNSIASSLVVLVYPGYLLTFLVRLLFFRHGDFVFLFLLCLVFFNDIGAYLFGRLFGKKTRLNLPVSPNKTVVGFVAGFIVSIGVGLVFYIFKPELFSAHIPVVLLFSALIGIVAILGDLVESAMKRGAEIKDSGALILGRGGVLDSIDSLLLCCPLFFLIYPLLA
jgi:phosphatidate cytidylyltransferase